MPTLTLTYNPVDGNTSSATGFNANLYDPANPPTSFEIINGWLDRTNREVSGTAWKVPWHKIRPRSMADSGSVGATANLDYFCRMFQQDVDATGLTGAFLPIPGASRSVYVSRAGGNVRVVASLVIANSLDDTTGNGCRLQMYRRAPGATTFTQVASTQQVVPPGELTSGGVTERRTYQDRQYTFHYLDIGVSHGEYEYALCVWLSGAYAATSGYTTNLVSARVRARSMTVNWMA